MARYGYDQFDFADDCKEIFEEFFLVDVQVQKDLDHPTISDFIVLRLDNLTSPVGIYQLLKFQYLKNFFPRITKKKSKTKGRPKTVNVDVLPKRLVILPVIFDLKDDEPRLVPIPYNFRGRTRPLKSKLNERTGKLSTNKASSSWLNKKIDEQMISAFQMTKDKRSPSYFANDEIRNIVKNLYKVIEIFYHKKVYKHHLRQKDMHDWIAKALNWRLKVELDLWRSFLELSNGRIDIFKSEIPTPRFSGRNIRDMLETSNSSE